MNVRLYFFNRFRCLYMVIGIWDIYLGELNRIKFIDFLSFCLWFGRYRYLMLERELLVGLFLLLLFCRVFRVVNRL